MKYATVKFGMMLAIALILGASNTSTSQEKESATKTKTADEGQVIRTVMTKEEQARLTPDAVLQAMKDGNARFNS